ncbi:MAG: N(4)-(beta-N-acetylglucosaminyl)-L-asparaginase [Ignavibacteria bacterium]
MQTRRNFLKLTSLFTLLFPFIRKTNFSFRLNKTGIRKPIVISTWNFGIPANAGAWEILNKGGWSLDAVEAGVKIPEADPLVRSVGYGALPDRDGYLTLDACIMDNEFNCGSVAFLQHIMHPISVARLVMERTPHIMLVGEGALKFALKNGFKKENLLTKEAEEMWKEWLKSTNYVPEIDSQSQNHDTIGMLALDNGGRLAGACTTSGLRYKMHGRVGDSPIIGAGLYVDGEIGAATATGIGEEVIRISGSHLIVELMRQGKTPRQACEEAVRRIIKAKKGKISDDLQVGFLALDKSGEYGAYAIREGFQYAVYSPEEQNVLKNADYELK